MDYTVKLRHTLDALFGSGVSRLLPDNLRIGISKKNGRIRSVYRGGLLLCTLRIDGSLALSVNFAQDLLKSGPFRQSCLEVDAESEPFVRRGSSVFCGHVVWCGENVHAAAETPVLCGGEVIAVGRAVLSGAAIMSSKRGVAVRVRTYKAFA